MMSPMRTEWAAMMLAHFMWPIEPQNYYLFLFRINGVHTGRAMGKGFNAPNPLAEPTEKRLDESSMASQTGCDIRAAEKAMGKTFAPSGCLGDDDS